MLDALAFGILTFTFAAVGWLFVPALGVFVVLAAAVAAAHFTLSAVYALAGRINEQLRRHYKADATAL